MNYLALLVVFWVLIITLFLRELLELLRQTSYWKSLAGFVAIWVVIENFGLKSGLWSYPQHSIAGVFLLGIPVEEYCFFILAHTAAVCSYKSFQA